MLKAFKLTALIPNSPIKLTAQLFIKAVSLTGLFHLWKIIFLLSQIWQEYLMLRQKSLSNQGC